MQAVIRFSVDGSAGNLRNRLAGHLEHSGFARHGTGSWKAKEISEEDLSTVVAEFWKRVADHPPPQKLDHF